MNIIAPIVLILASIGLFFGYINPTYTGNTFSVEPAGKSVSELQSEEKDYGDALNKARQIELVREGLLSKFNALNRSDKERILKLLPDHIDSVRLIIDINNIAARYGMSLAGITLSAPNAASNKNQAAGPAQIAEGKEAGLPQGIGPDGSLYDSVKLGFTVAGPYENFLGFLKELEESLRIVEITSLSFGTPSSGGQSQSAASGAYVYSITIRTYYLK
ncbi:MAG: hypothetical protein HYV67_04480 [Candidatus Taylorbacteria bacterium]|nr:hypothetical protein [Candidatus Taylorbacteria bacterium]